MLSQSFTGLLINEPLKKMMKKNNNCFDCFGGTVKRYHINALDNLFRLNVAQFVQTLFQFMTIIARHMFYFTHAR